MEWILGLHMLLGVKFCIVMCIVENSCLLGVFVDMYHVSVSVLCSVFVGCVGYVMGDFENNNCSWHRFILITGSSCPLSVHWEELQQKVHYCVQSKHTSALTQTTKVLDVCSARVFTSIPYTPWVGSAHEDSQRCWGPLQVSSSVVWLISKKFSSLQG